MNRSSRSTRWLATAALVGMLATVPPAAAHQQWLAPNFFFDAGESAWLSFDHTFGDRRFLPGSGPGSYYRWWIVGPDGLRRSVPFLFLGKTRTVGEVEIEEPGTYRLEGEEALMPWTQIEVDGKNHWHPGTRAEFEGSKIVRSRVYFSKAVSYVSLASTSRSALAPSGDPLEIVFEDHPNELQEGQTFRVTVMASKQPLAEQEVQMYPERGSAHDEAAATCVSNSSGVCRLTPGAPGRYLLVTGTEGDNAEGAETDGYSHRLTVLVDVKAAAEKE